MGAALEKEPGWVRSRTLVDLGARAGLTAVKGQSGRARPFR